MWVDTLTALRYDWDYSDDVWRTKGTATGAVPPLPVEASGSATLDNRSAYWIRDTFNLLHKYDSTANAWAPWGDWFYLANPPTDIAATGSNGAAKYRRSLWQDSDDNVVYYFDGAMWSPLVSAADGSETIVTEGTGIDVTGTGTSGDPYVVTNTGDPSVTNEGVLGVGAGGSNDADLLSNTSGAIGVNVIGGTGIGVSESTSSNGGSITIANTGDLSNTNEVQTISAGGAGPTSYTVDLSLSGGSVTLSEGSNIDLTRSGNTITIASTASGGLTSAENGLYVSGSTVRLGGGSSSPLIETTQIDQDGNDFRIWGAGKMSVSSGSTGGFTAANARFAVGGEEGLPTTSGSSTIDAIATFNAMSGINRESNEIAVGGYVTNTDGMWIQARSYVVPNFEYPLSMQPRGGQFSVGRFGGLDALATIAGSGLTGSSVSGSVLHLEHSEGHGNVPLSFGAGTDILDAEIMWRDADDAFRVTNRNSVNNSSSIRFAIGGQTNDLAALVKSSNGTSLAKFGVGVGSPASIHTTIQSAGGFAARALTTVGSFTLDESNYLVIYTGSGSVTWTLPTASTCTGREYILCSRGTGTVNLSASVSKGAGGNFNSLSSGQWAMIWSDGSSWTGFKLSSL